MSTAVAGSASDRDSLLACSSRLPETLKSCFRCLQCVGDTIEREAIWVSELMPGPQAWFRVSCHVTEGIGPGLCSLTVELKDRDVGSQLVDLVGGLGLHSRLLARRSVQSTTA